METKFTKEDAVKFSAILRDLSDQERAALKDWIEELLKIRALNVGRREKLRLLVRAMKNAKPIWPVIREFVARIKMVFWQQRSGSWKVFWGFSAAGMALVGFQGVGVAALGGAIGFPLWVVFGAGGLMAKSALEELSHENTKQ